MRPYKDISGSHCVLASNGKLSKLLGQDQPTKQETNKITLDL